MALWGSTIDPSKAKLHWQPVVDYALPETDVFRPVLNDPEVTGTIHAKPTDHLPSDHGLAMSPHPTAKPVNDSAGDAWYSHMATLVSAQKWFFAGLGFASVFLVAALVYFWRRRMANKRLAAYTSLAANDIHMEPVNESHGPAGSGRRYDELEEEGSREEQAARSEVVVVPSAPPVGLGFHSGFLDDDEPSAALSPKYRDEPESAVPRALKSSGGKRE